MYAPAFNAEKGGQTPLWDRSEREGVSFVVSLKDRLSLLSFSHLQGILPLPPPKTTLHLGTFGSKRLELCFIALPVIYFLSSPSGKLHTWLILHFAYQRHLRREGFILHTWDQTGGRWRCSAVPHPHHRLPGILFPLPEEAAHNQDGWTPSPSSSIHHGGDGTCVKTIFVYLKRTIGGGIPPHTPVSMHRIGLVTFWDISCFSQGEQDTDPSSLC